MQNRMRTISTIVFLFIVQLCTAQKDSSTVNNNQTKIEELKERLENLSVKKESEPFDSTAYKIDYMFQEFKKLRLEVNQLNESIQKCNTAKVPIQIETNNSKLIANKNSIDVEAFYVVLNSDRTLEGADEKLSKTKEYDAYNIIIVENARKTWYHLVLKERLSKAQAQKNTYSFRKKGFSDAWWTASKNLIH